MSQLRTGSVGFVALLTVGCTWLATGCAKGETKDDAKRTWSCVAADVPMGEVINCTTAALTTGDSLPVTTVGSGGPAPSEGAPYECGPDTTSAECPPSDVGTAGGTNGDVTTEGGGVPPEAGGEPSPEGSPVGTQGGIGNGNGNGNGRGPSECKYVPGSCGSGDDASPPAPETCTKPNCDAPGQVKKTPAPPSGGDGAGSPSGEAGGGSAEGHGNGNGRRWRCTKNGSGDATCTSEPACTPGTHPAPCGACVPDGSTSDCVPPAEGGCWVTGGGFVLPPNLARANFGGNAKPMKDGSVSGHWNHVDHGTGNHAKGRPEYIFCRHVDEPGPGQPGGKKGVTMNQVYFGGHAQWRSNDVWAEGYWFDVVAKDHGEPGSKSQMKSGMPDSYHFTLRKMDDPSQSASGTVVYETKGELEGGNVQMHPPNGGHPAVQSQVPSWVALEP